MTQQDETYTYIYFLEEICYTHVLYESVALAIRFSLALQQKPAIQAIKQHEHRTIQAT